MPYGYYQFVRFMGLIGFGFLAYDSNNKGNQTSMIVYIALAILFQPLFKISFGRELWNIIDVIAGLGLIITVFLYAE